MRSELGDEVSSEPSFDVGKVTWVRCEEAATTKCYTVVYGYE